MDPAPNPTLRRQVVAETFRRTMRYVPTSVAVVATTVNDAPVGMLIGSFVSVSLEPPLVGFFGDLGSTTLPRLLTAQSLAFSVLAQDARAVCDAFRLPAAQRFAAIDWSPSPRGNPILASSVVAIEGPMVSTQIIGDHVLVTVEVETADALSTRCAGPLLFHDGSFGRLDPSASTPVHLAHLDWSF
jgi:3-hydroxy-9,10-secoandrosta-1,3,5(10)-triene-9,17-dione monooxygenase reductase component